MSMFAGFFLIAFSAFTAFITTERGWLRPDPIEDPDAEFNSRKL